VFNYRAAPGTPSRFLCFIGGVIIALMLMFLVNFAPAPRTMVKALPTEAPLPMVEIVPEHLNVDVANKAFAECMGTIKDTVLGASFMGEDATDTETALAKYTDNCVTQAQKLATAKTFQ
jgi:hypothetical protein